jgi:hypothetical protein
MGSWTPFELFYPYPGRVNFVLESNGIKSRAAAPTHNRSLPSASEVGPGFGAEVDGNAVVEFGIILESRECSGPQPENIETMVKKPAGRRRTAIGRRLLAWFPVPSLACPTTGAKSAAMHCGRPGGMFRQGNPSHPLLRSHNPFQIASACAVIVTSEPPVGRAIISRPPGR